jgi:hypothetical protein
MIIRIKQMIALHHILNPETPFYGGNGRFDLKQIRSISDGDTSNSTELMLLGAFQNPY